MIKKYLKTNALCFALHYSVVKCSEDLLKNPQNLLFCYDSSISISTHLTFVKKVIFLLMVHIYMDSSFYAVTSDKCLSGIGSMLH
jgi:hypothetical protein